MAGLFDTLTDKEKTKKKTTTTKSSGLFSSLITPEPTPSYTPITKQRTLEADRNAEAYKPTGYERFKGISPTVGLSKTLSNIGEEVKTNIALTPQERLEKIMLPIQGAKSRWVNTSLGLAQTGKEALQFISEQDKGLLPKLMPNAKQDAQVAERTIQQAEQKAAPILNYGANLKGLDKTAYETGQQLTSLGMTAISPGASLLTTSVGAGGQKTRELEQAGASEKAQRIGGAVSGAMEFGTEIVGDMLTFKMLKGQGTLNDYLANLGIETAGEMLTEAVDPYINKAAIPNYDMPTVQERIANVGQAGFSAAITSILIGGMANGIGSVTTALKTPTKQNVQQAIQDTVQDMETKGTPLNQEALTKLEQEFNLYQETPSMIPPQQQTIETELPQGELNPNLERFQTEQAIQQRKLEESQAQQFEPIENPNFSQELAERLKPVEKVEPIQESISEEALTTLLKSKGLSQDLEFKALDNYDELVANKVPINNDGTVTLYHHTTQDSANKIIESSKIKGEEDGVFFTTKPYGQASGFGDTVIKANIPLEKLSIDDVFSDEVHLRIPTKRIGQSVRIDASMYQPTEQAPTTPQQPQAQPNIPTPQETAPIEPQTIEKAIQPKLQPIKPQIPLKAKIEPLIKTTLNEDIGIRDEAEVAKMIVRAETLKEDIKAIKEIAPEEVSALAKYDKLIDEIFEKGMSRASKNQINRLIATEQSIKPLKEKYKQQLADVKEQAKLKQQEKELKKKESTLKTKLLKVSKEMQQGKLQPEFQKVANEMFGNIDTMAKSISSKKLIELEKTLDNIAELEEQGILVDEDLRKSVARLNRKQIADLTIDETQDLLDLASHLKHLNTTKNKALAFERNTDIKQMAQGIANDLLIKPSRKAKKAIKTDTIVENKGRLEFITSFVGRPALTIRNLMYEVGRANDNSKAVQLADEILDRANVENKNRRLLTKMLNDKIGDYHKLASSPKWNKVQDNGFTSGEKVYLKLALNDANVLESLEQMGYRRKTSLSPTKISRSEIESLKLNADEQKAYNVGSEFFEETYNLLNEAYLLQNGYELKRADKGKYLPKKVSDMTIREELGQVMLPGGLKNTGVIQARKGTLNELILPDIMDIYQRQIDIATKYNAYTNLVQDVSKVFSKPELRTALRTEYGQDKNGKSIVENYMNDLFQDLQGTKQASRTKIEDGLRTIRTKAAPAILAFRATTPLIQTASYPMALTEINFNNLVKGLVGKDGFKEAKQYNERANARDEGRIDRELAESKVNAFTNLGLKPIQAVDKATVGKLWNATKYQVAEETGLSGEKLFQATSKRFDRVLDTQPNYTTADRSMTMRSQSEVDKALTMFSSAKSSVLNELKRGYIKGKYTGDYSQLAKASAGLTTSIFMMAAISNALKKVEGDEEKFTESLMKRTLGALPLLDIVTSVMQGYDISNVGVDTIEDLGKAFTSTIDLVINTATDKQIDERKLVKTFWDTVDASALMLGIPVETLRNDIKLAVGVSGNDALKVLFERYTDPLNKTELYKKIASPTSEKALQGLLKQLKNVDTDEKKLETNLKSKLKEGKMTNERLEQVLKQIKPK